MYFCPGHLSQILLPSDEEEDGNGYDGDISSNDDDGKDNGKDDDGTF